MAVLIVGVPGGWRGRRGMAPFVVHRRSAFAHDRKAWHEAAGSVASGAAARRIGRIIGRPGCLLCVRWFDRNQFKTPICC